MHKDKVKAIRDSIVRNSKFIFPFLVIAIVAVTVAFALKAGERKTDVSADGVTGESPDSLQEAIVDSVESIILSTTPEPSPEATPALSEDVPLAANEDANIYSVVANYYNSMALGDEVTLKSLYDEISENDLLRYVETAKYLDYYTALDVYTKPGYADGSTLAYVYYKLRFKNHEEEFPGYQTLYICTKEDGSLYIKNESNFTENEIDYIVKVNAQADVADFTNRVNVEYQEMMVAKPELLEYLGELGDTINAAIGVALAANNATDVPEVEEPVQPTEEPVATEAPVVNLVQYAVATTTVNVRGSDSEKADKLGQVVIGTRIQVQEVLVNGWTKVVFEGSDAYIKSEYLKMEENVGELEIVGKVTATTTINIRSQATTSSAKLGSMLAGTSLDWLGDEGDWCKVIYNNQLAYVKAEFVTKEN